MPLCHAISAILFASLDSPSVAAEVPLHLKRLGRCGDLLASEQQEWCLRVHSLGIGPPRLLLNGRELSATALWRKDDGLWLRLDRRDHASGPFWLEQGGCDGNPVWLTLNDSHVLVAGPDEIAKNTDGLTTYANLASLLAEENRDDCQEVGCLAGKYGARVVGAVPPLSLYQLRLPARGLVQCDALVLRIGSETSVDIVAVEEPAPEKDGETEVAYRPMDKPDSDSDEWAANRFMDAVNHYQCRVCVRQIPLETYPIRIGVVERDVDFDTPDLAGHLSPYKTPAPRTCLYTCNAERPDSHGLTIAGILAARWGQDGNSDLPRGLDRASQGSEVIVKHNSDAGITVNIAASVNLVEDGVRVFSWSWGIHRVGTRDVDGDEVDPLVRSRIAMSDYEELFGGFFLRLRKEHPDMLVVNSAGNGSSYSDTDEYRLSSPSVTEQSLVVDGHQRSERQGLAVDDPAYTIRRSISSVDIRMDVITAACTHASTLERDTWGEVHCGTSYATPMVAGTVTTMFSLNPRLQPEGIRMLLQCSIITTSGDYGFESADAEDLTVSILSSEHGYCLDHRGVGRSARLDMQKTLDPTVKSRERVR